VEEGWIKICMKFVTAKCFKKIITAPLKGILINGNTSWWNYAYSMTQKLLTLDV